MYKSKRLLCVISALLLLLGCTPAAASVPSVAQQTSSVPLYGYPVPTSEITNPEFYTTGVKTEFADLGPDVWEIKRLTVKYDGVHVQDMAGKLTHIKSGYYKITDLTEEQLLNTNISGGDETLSDSQAMLFPLIMNGFKAGNIRGGLFEFRGFYYFYVGDCIDYTDPATNGMVYPLYAHELVQPAYWARFTGTTFSMFVTTIKGNYRNEKFGGIITGIEAIGFNLPDDEDDSDLSCE